MFSVYIKEREPKNHNQKQKKENNTTKDAHATANHRVNTEREITNASHYYFWQHYHLNRIAPPFTVFRYLHTILSGVVYKINICYGRRDRPTISGARISRITIRIEPADVWPALLYFAPGSRSFIVTIAFGY